MPDSPLPPVDARRAQVSASVIAVARAAWPGIEVPPERFRDYVTERVASADDAAVAGLNTVDLYLACACALGSPEAIAKFGETLLPDCDVTLASFASSVGLVDEVKQRLRVKLFVGGKAERAGIEAYAGRGSLRSWLRVTATREALNLTRQTAKEVPLAYGPAQPEPVMKLDPELQYLRSSCAEEFERAFRDAVRLLTTENRNLLRYHYLDGLGIDPLGVILGVHRVTASRRLNAARATLVQGTRRLLAERLRLGSNDLESMLRLIDSELDISLRQALASHAAAVG